MTRTGGPKNQPLPLRVGPKVLSPTPDAPGAVVRTESEPTAPPVPAVVFPASAHLEAELARRQLRLVEAKHYVGQGLAQIGLVETSAEMEVALGNALRSLARHGAVQADEVFQAATVGLNEKLLAQLPRVFNSHKAAISQDLPESEREAFAQKASGLFEDLAGLALKHLGGTKPPDRKAAFESMRAASEQLNGIRTPITYMYDSFHAYTNESGLWPLLQSLPVHHGAAVGVGGALLEVAAQRRSSMVVLTDVQPELRLFVLAVAGVFLAVDKMAEDNGWDDQRRCDEIRDRLGSGAGDMWRRPFQDVVRSPVETIDELRALNIDEDILPGLLAALEGAQGSQGRAGWLTDNDSILHLTQLALQGRIVATTTDIGDPVLGQRLKMLLEAHDVAVGSLHLSNALDYTADAESPSRILRQVPVEAGAVVTSSSDFEYVEILGSFMQPKSTDVSDWLKADGTEGALQESPSRQNKLDTLYDAICGRAKTLGITLETSKPTTIEAYEAIKNEVDAQALADPKTAGLWVERQLNDLSGRNDAVGLMLPRLSEPAREALCSPPPKSAAAFAERLDVASHRFWTTKAKKKLAREFIDASPVELSVAELKVLDQALPRTQPNLVRFLTSRTLQRAARNALASTS